MRNAPSSEVNRDLPIASDDGREYKILNSLGRGGNASAFLVVGRSGSERGLPFAAKFFLHKDTKCRAAFVREIEYLRDHPHGAVLPISGAGTSPEGFPFYVSRYMATTLERVIATESAPMFDRLLYASQLSSALLYLSSATPPILHRDVKVENVFVNGRTCLLGDFGMMQALGPDPVERIMPWEARTPDLVRFLDAGAPPTTQSDVFALGVVLYRLFTGERALRWAEKKTDPVLLDSLVSTGGRYADQLDDILRRMLRDDPLRRIAPLRLVELFTELVIAEAERRREVETPVRLAG